MKKVSLLRIKIPKYLQKKSKTSKHEIDKNIFEIVNTVLKEFVLKKFDLQMNELFDKFGNLHQTRLIYF